MSRRSLTRALPLMAALAGVACAGATTQGSRESCVLTYSDSVYLAGGPVYRGCAVDRRARLEPSNVRPNFEPTSTTVGSTCYSVLIELVVDPTGRPEPETAKVVRTNNDAFAAAVLAIMPQWRYQPARKDGAAVRQIVQERYVIAAQVMRVRAGDIPRPGPSPRC